MPLRPSKAVTIDNPDYFTKLIVRPVRRDDSGEYTVTAMNSSGKDTVTINVVVTDKPSKPEGPLQVKQAQQVKFTCCKIYRLSVSDKIGSYWRIW